MTVWLLLGGAFFAYLAWDARKLTQRQGPEVPYEVEAAVRDEKLDGVSLVEQSRRASWNRRYGIGDTSQMAAAWTFLSALCVVGAVVSAVA